MHREENAKTDASEKHGYSNTGPEQHDLCKLATIPKAPTMFVVVALESWRKWIEYCARSLSNSCR